MHAFLFSSGFDGSLGAKSKLPVFGVFFNSVDNNPSTTTFCPVSFSVPAHHVMVTAWCRFSLGLINLVFSDNDVFNKINLETKTQFSVHTETEVIYLPGFEFD